MPYNELDIDGQHKVEGHKYMDGGAGRIAIYSGTTTTSTDMNLDPLPKDGIVSITISKSSAGGTFNVYLNGQSGSICGVNIGFPTFQSWQFPLKQGDILRIWANIAIDVGVYLYPYR